MHQIVGVAVRPLTRTPMTPNHLTTGRLITGLLAATMYTLGQELFSILASTLFIISIFLDRADGELARMTGKSSSWGHKYDLISDSICNSLIFVGIGIGLKDSELGLWAIPLGIAAGLSIAIILILVVRTENCDGARAAELKGIGGFDPDDAMLLVPIAMLVGWGTILIAVAAICAPLFSVFFYLKFRKYLF